MSDDYAITILESRYNIMGKKHKYFRNLDYKNKLETLYKELDYFEKF